MDYPDFHSKGEAPCRNPDNEDIDFFPSPYEKGSGEISRVAKSVCNTGEGCNYRTECLAWALFNGEPGVWGGTSENDRRRMTRLPLSVKGSGSRVSA